MIMDPIKLASGDSNEKNDSYSPRFDTTPNNEAEGVKNESTTPTTEITPQAIDENEMKLKYRIAQCRNIIESLKLELNEEKVKIEKEAKSNQNTVQEPIPYTSDYKNYSHSDHYPDGDMDYNPGMFSASVDSRLGCDESLIEYEKQLQKYQNTLNMAQMEKKNAIRKQMLTKAYKLKLLEVENQCNIELLRVKQSLQCLEPLQMIASKWKIPSEEDSMFDLNNFELMPRYPELSALSGSDVGSIKDGDRNDTKNLTESPKYFKDDNGSFERL